MLDGFSIASYPPLVGAIALVMFPYLQMARGRLVPRSAVEDVLKNADYWREAHRVSEEARTVQAQTAREQTEQMKELLEHAKTSDALLRSVTERMERSP
jgi:hypothetical protein